MPKETTARNDAPITISHRDQKASISSLSGWLGS